VQQKITIGTVCFIEDASSKKVLLLQRSRDPMRGKCTGVGGKTEFFEDIRDSCLREAFEETGLVVHSLELKGILKTVLQGNLSSWILFVYTAQATGEEVAPCDEGQLLWVQKEDLPSINLIGFIRSIIDRLFTKGSFFEGIATHDADGKVLSEKIMY
jgi:8-oxo-dGTP diphosphatase